MISPYFRRVLGSAETRPFHKISTPENRWKYGILRSVNLRLSKFYYLMYWLSIDAYFVGVRWDPRMSSCRTEVAETNNGFFMSLVPKEKNHWSSKRKSSIYYWMQNLVSYLQTKFHSHRMREIVLRTIWSEKRGQTVITYNEFFENASHLHISLNVL